MNNCVCNYFVKRSFVYKQTENKTIEQLTNNFAKNAYITKDMTAVKKVLIVGSIPSIYPCTKSCAINVDDIEQSSTSSSMHPLFHIVNNVLNTLKENNVEYTTINTTNEHNNNNNDSDIVNYVEYLQIKEHNSKKRSQPTHRSHQSYNNDAINQHVISVNKNENKHYKKNTFLNMDISQLIKYDCVILYYVPNDFLLNNGNIVKILCCLNTNGYLVIPQNSNPQFSCEFNHIFNPFFQN